MLADGRHLLTDVWASAAVIGGILLVRLTKIDFFDPACALLMAGYIAWTGFDVMLLISFLGSFGALAYFFRVMDMRRTEQTAQTPPDLAAATVRRAQRYLRTVPTRSVRYD